MLSIVCDFYFSNIKFRFMKIQSFFLFLSIALLSATAVFAQSADEAAIKKVIEAETAAFQVGELELWKSFWQIQPYTRALSTRADGVHFDITQEMLKNPPQGVLGRGSSCVNTNYLIHISTNGDMAWSSFDQVETRKDSTKAYAHQMRILEKINGAWKLVGSSVHWYKP
jgi:hypothetical protein